jgi:hypothetical protein
MSEYPAEIVILHSIQCVPLVVKYHLVTDTVEADRGSSEENQEK